MILNGRLFLDPDNLLYGHQLCVRTVGLQPFGNSTAPDKQYCIQAILKGKTKQSNEASAAKYQFVEALGVLYKQSMSISGRIKPTSPLWLCFVIYY